MTDQQQLRAIEEIVARSAEDLRRRHAEVIKDRAEGLAQTVVASLQWFREQQHDDFQAVQAGVEELGWVIESLDRAVRQGFLRLEYYARLVHGELTQIRAALEGPLATQAKELRERAEYAAAQGWIDEALRDFLAAEKKNYQDFTVLLNVGNIYLEKEEYAKALGYFEKTTTYARPRSAGAAATALRNAACVRDLQGDLQGAYTTISEARKLDAEDVKIAYLHAKHAARTGHAEEALESLRFLLRKTPETGVVAIKESDFASLWQRILVLVEELRRETDARVDGLLASISEVGRYLRELGGEAADDAVRAIKVGFDGVRERLGRQGYMDSVNAEREAKKILAESWAAVACACEPLLESLKEEESRLATGAEQARNHAAAAMTKYVGRGWGVYIVVFWCVFMLVNVVGVFAVSGATGFVVLVMLSASVAFVLSVVAGTSATRRARLKERARFLEEAERLEEKGAHVKRQVSNLQSLKEMALTQANRSDERGPKS